MPEMIVKQDAVRSQATLKKVEEEVDHKQAGGNKQQSYARNEQVKAQQKKEAEQAEVRKKLTRSEKKVALLEGKKHELEKRAAGQPGQKDQKADHTPAEKAKTEVVEKKKSASQKGEEAAQLNEGKQEKVKAAQVPDKDEVVKAKQKTDEAEREQDEEQAQEQRAEKQEADEENEGKAPPAAVATAKGKVKPDAAALQLKAVKANLAKAYEEQRGLTRQLIGLLNGLAGLETNLEKRKKLTAEAKTKLADKLLKLGQKQDVLKKA